MKKLVSVIVTLLVMTGAVFAQDIWKDGTYTAEADAIPEGGGKYKYLASVQGDYGMVANGGAQSEWYVQVDAVDAISGVSITIMPHFELAAEALQNARR